MLPGTVLLLLSLAPAPASRPSIDEAAVVRLTQEFADRLARSRYMESADPQPVKVAGWEGFPTMRHRYSVTDKDGVTKTADVIMLNPTARQMAQWIVSALVEVKGKYDPDEGGRIFRHVLAQSGGQFPVAGVVYEDILPADGKNEIFCFRDGVTVAIGGVPHRGTEPMSPPQIAASIDGKVTRVYTYARIQSTSPKDWLDAGCGPAEIVRDGKPTDAWLTAVRQAYQAAWTSPRNALLVAWLRSHPK
jgi:hypothetical protein